MSKRKNRTGAPNLPKETLERARRQAAIERGEIPAEPESVEIVEEKPPAPAPTVSRSPSSANPYRTVSARERRARTEVRTGERRMRRAAVGARGDDELDSQTIAELLANPTKIVTEDELRRDYSYVLADLRNMGLLAAGLVVALIVLAQVLPR